VTIDWLLVADKGNGNLAVVNFDAANWIATNTARSSEVLGHSPLMQARRRIASSTGVEISETSE
jgi:hypothetical protein